MRADLTILAPSPNAWAALEEEVWFRLEEAQLNPKTPGLSRIMIHDGKLERNDGQPYYQSGVRIRISQADAVRAQTALLKSDTLKNLRIHIILVHPRDDEEWHRKQQKNAYPAGDTSKRPPKAKDRTPPSEAYRAGKRERISAKRGRDPRVARASAGDRPKGLNPARPGEPGENVADAAGEPDPKSSDLH